MLDAPDEWRLKILSSWPSSDQFARGQCVSCGFLSRRSIHPQVPVADEVPIDARQHGQLFMLADGVQSVPWCLVRAANLMGEVAEQDKFMREWVGSDAADAPPPTKEKPGTISWRQMLVQRVIFKDRECPEWWPYREFQSPAEHREERNMMRLEEERKANQLKLAELEDRSRKIEGRWTIMFAIFAALSIAAQLFYPNGIDLAATWDWLRSLVQ